MLFLALIQNILSNVQEDHIGTEVVIKR